jgi:tetratricopeptide (TPR) repeat protein
MTGCRLSPLLIYHPSFIIQHRALIQTRARILGVFVVALAAGCASPHVFKRKTTQSAYGAYLRGLMLERSSQFPGALDAYQLALRHDQRSPLLRVRVGAAYVKMGRMDRALQSFEQALAMDPDQPDALRWLAMINASQGKLDPAVAAYERLLAIEPKDQFVISTLADLYVLQGELEKAISLYEGLIREFGSTSQLHFNLGVLHGRLNRFDDALCELSRATELSPDSVETRVALGLTYELGGSPEKAAAQYEDAIRLDAFNPRLYHHAARAHVASKQYPEAAANFEASLDLAPQDFEAIMGLVRVRIAQKHYDEAQRFLAHKLKEFDQTPELYVALGLLYREVEQLEEAMRAFEQALTLREDYAQAHFYLAAQLDRLGRKQDARINLRRTIELDPNHPDALNYLGYLDAEAGLNLKEAKALIERAVAIDPDNGSYLDSLGWVDYQMGNIDEAIRHLERAASLLGTDPVIFDHLGEAYFTRHELERARQNWQRALELGAERDAILEKLDRITSPHEAATP